MRSRLGALGMLLIVLGAMLGTAVFLPAADSKPRVAASVFAAHSVEVGNDSGAGRDLCAKRADRMGGPADHKLKTSENREHAATRRVIDHHPDAAQPAGGDIVPPGETVFDDFRPAEDLYKYQAYRTFDGRAPPRAAL